MRIVIGEGSCGLAAGAGAVHARLEKLLAQGNPAGATLGITGCIGMCFLEPIVDVYDDEGALHRFVKVQEKDADTIYSAVMAGDLSLADKLLITPQDEEFLAKQTRIALRDCGIIDPENIDDYIAHGGYQAIAKVLGGMTPEDYNAFTYTEGQPPKAMFHNAMEAYSDKIAEDFGNTVLEVFEE